MSCRVLKGLYGVTWVVTVCDSCHDELHRKHAEPHEMSGRTYPVHHHCKACMELARPPSSGPGVVIGNVPAIRTAKIHLETISEPPTRNQAITNQLAIRINRTIADIKALETLKKTVDPASGLAVQVRRGVLRDDPEEADQARPWTALEHTDNMPEILDLLLGDLRAKLRRAIRFCEQEAQELAAAHKAGQDFLAP